MQGFPGEINLYVRDSVITYIPSVLKREGGDELVERFKMESPFGYLLDIRRNGSANVALHELLARELTDGSFSEFERWFHVGGTDIRFGPQEFCLVTGLVFGPSEFDPYSRPRVIPRTSLFHTKYNGQKTKVDTLMRDFKSFDGSRSLGSPDQYLKAANLLMYYSMLLCRGKATIEDWAWELVEDQVRWYNFPWGSWSFQILCHALGVMKKDPVEISGLRPTYHFYGPVWALNLWAYEAIPSLGAACGVQDREHLTPRLRRWHTRQSHLDFERFFDNLEVTYLIRYYSYFLYLCYNFELINLPIFNLFYFIFCSFEPSERSNRKGTSSVLSPMFRL